MRHQWRSPSHQRRIPCKYRQFQDSQRNPDKTCSVRWTWSSCRFPGLCFCSAQDIDHSCQRCWHRWRRQCTFPATCISKLLQRKRQRKVEEEKPQTFSSMKSLRMKTNDLLYQYHRIHAYLKPWRQSLKRSEEIKFVSMSIRFTNFVNVKKVCQRDNFKAKIQKEYD